MQLHKRTLAFVATSALALPLLFAGTASALTASCVGAPSTASITWSASSTAGIAPFAYLWGNGSTSTVQTIAATAGTYSMTLQVTDASSTVATTTCSATVAATSTTATTTPSVAAQIQSLLSQIQALRAQLVELLMRRQGGWSATTTPATPRFATTTPPFATCLKFNRDLSFGDRGDDVRELQEKLAEDSELFPRGLVTGFFGEKTKDAVRKFQLKYGLIATSTNGGFFGPQTRGLINGHCGNIHSIIMSTKKWGWSTTTDSWMGKKHGPNDRATSTDDDDDDDDDDDE